MDILSEIVEIDPDALRVKGPGLLWPEEPDQGFVESVRVAGIMDPVLVEETGGGYRLAAGYKRVRGRRGTGRPLSGANGLRQRGGTGHRLCGFQRGQDREPGRRAAASGPGLVRPEHGPGRGPGSHRTPSRSAGRIAPGAHVLLLAGHAGTAHGTRPGRAAAPGLHRHSGAHGQGRAPGRGPVFRPLGLVPEQWPEFPDLGTGGRAGGGRTGGGSARTWAVF